MTGRRSDNYIHPLNYGFEPGKLGKPAVASVKDLLDAGPLVRTLAATYVLWQIPFGTAYALPQNGQVVEGQVEIRLPDQKTMELDQSTKGAVINWDSFDVDPDESLWIFQPTADSWLLNRVNDGGASQLLGQIKANGGLTLVNPAGITVGNQARIDVGNLILSTQDIENDAFMDGVETGRFTFGGAGLIGMLIGTIENYGEISVADGGLSALVAPTVANHGVIQADLGQIVLAGTNHVTVDFYGDDLIHFGTEATVADPEVMNAGTLQANGGSVVMTATAARGIVDNVINMSGAIVADTVVEEEGEIILFAGHGGAEVSGSLQATGDDAHEKGGLVDVRAEYTNLLAGAEVNTGGLSGGGSIKVGGDYQGNLSEGSLSDPGNRLQSADSNGLSGGLTGGLGSVQAQRTSIAEGASLLSNAGDHGDGGDIVVWADDHTDFDGHLEAKGGQQYGNGGLAEVSGKQTLGFRGTVDLTADNGETGGLLLDPYNVTISSDPSTYIAQAAVPGSVTIGDNGDDAILNVGILNSALASSIVKVQASGGIDVNADVTGSNSLTLDADAGNIIIRNNIVLTGSTSNLNVSATGGFVSMTGGSADMTIGGGVTMDGDSGIKFGAGGSLYAGGDVLLNTPEYIINSAPIRTTSGNVTLNTGTTQGPIVIGLGGDITSDAGDIFLYMADGTVGGQPTDALTLNDDLIASAGTVHLNSKSDFTLGGASGLVPTAKMSNIQSAGVSYTADGFGITVNGALNRTGNLTLTADQDIRFNAGGNVTAGGDLNINAGDRIYLSSGASSISAGGALNLTGLTDGIEFTGSKTFTLGANSTFAGGIDAVEGGGITINTGGYNLIIADSIGAQSGIDDLTIDDGGAGTGTVTLPTYIASYGAIQLSANTAVSSDLSIVLNGSFGEPGPLSITSPLNAGGNTVTIEVGNAGNGGYTNSIYVGGGGSKYQTVALSSLGNISAGNLQLKADQNVYVYSMTATALGGIAGNVSLIASNSDVVLGDSGGSYSLDFGARPLIARAYRHVSVQGANVSGTGGLSLSAGYGTTVTGNVDVSGTLTGGSGNVSLDGNNISISGSVLTTASNGEVLLSAIDSVGITGSASATNGVVEVYSPGSLALGTGGSNAALISAASIAKINSRDVVFEAGTNLDVYAAPGLDSTGLVSISGNVALKAASGLSVASGGFTTGNKSVNLVASTFAIGGPIDTGTASISLTQASGSMLIGQDSLGSGLAISQAEINYFTAASLNFTGASGSGVRLENVTFSDPIYVKTLGNGGNVSLVGDITSSGDVSINSADNVSSYKGDHATATLSGANIDITGAGSIFALSGAISASGNLSLSTTANTLALSNNMTIAGSGGLYGTGGTTDVEISASAVLSAASWTINAASRGTVRTFGSTSISGGNTYLSGSNIDLQGSISAAGGLDIYSSGDVHFQSSSDIVAGSISISGSQSGLASRVTLGGSVEVTNNGSVALETKYLSFGNLSATLPSGASLESGTYSSIFVNGTNNISTGGALTFADNIYGSNSKLYVTTSGANVSFNGSVGDSVYPLSYFGIYEGSVAGGTAAISSVHADMGVYLSVPVSGLTHVNTTQLNVDAAVSSSNQNMAIYAKGLGMGASGSLSAGTGNLDLNFSQNLLIGDAEVPTSARLQGYKLAKMSGAELDIRTVGGYYIKLGDLPAASLTSFTQVSIESSDSIYVAAGKYGEQQFSASTSFEFGNRPASLVATGAIDVRFGTYLNAPGGVTMDAGSQPVSIRGYVDSSGSDVSIKGGHLNVSGVISVGSGTLSLYHTGAGAVTLGSGGLLTNDELAHLYAGLIDFNLGSSNLTFNAVDVTQNSSDTKFTTSGTATFLGSNNFHDVTVISGSTTVTNSGAVNSDTDLAFISTGDISLASASTIDGGTIFLNAISATVHANSATIQGSDTVTSSVSGNMFSLSGADINVAGGLDITATQTALSSANSVTVGGDLAVNGNVNGLGSLSLYLDGASNTASFNGAIGDVNTPAALYVTNGTNATGTTGVYFANGVSTSGAFEIGEISADDINATFSGAGASTISAASFKFSGAALTLANDTEFTIGGSFDTRSTHTVGSSVDASTGARYGGQVDTHGLIEGATFKGQSLTVKANKIYSHHVGKIRALNELTFKAYAAGAGAINLGSEFNTGGNQAFYGEVALDAAVVILSDTGDVILADPVSGAAANLALYAPQGNVEDSLGGGVVLDVGGVTSSSGTNLNIDTANSTVNGASGGAIASEISTVADPILSNPDATPAPTPAPAPGPSPTPNPTPAPTVEPPSPTVEPPLPTVEPPLPTTEPPLPTTEPPLPTAEPPQPTPEPPIPTPEPTLTPGGRDPIPDNPGEDIPIPTAEPGEGNLRLPEPTLEPLLQPTEEPLPGEDSQSGGDGGEDSLIGATGLGPAIGIPGVLDVVLLGDAGGHIDEDDDEEGGNANCVCD